MQKGIQDLMNVTLFRFTEDIASSSQVVSSGQ